MKTTQTKSPHKTHISYKTLTISKFHNIKDETYMFFG
jgi:hypothetical protein